MLAENLENLVKKERQTGEQQGIEKTARNLLRLGVLSDEQIAEATGMAVDEIAQLRLEDKH